MQRRERKAPPFFNSFHWRTKIATSPVDILVLPYTPMLSHLSRPLALALELRKRGFNPVFAGRSEKAGFLSAEGFEVLRIFEPDETALYDNIRRGKLRFVHASVLKKMIDADLEIFRQTKPSLVLTDGRFSAPISTQIVGVGHAAIVNASSTPYRAIPYAQILSESSRIWKRIGNRRKTFLEKINLKMEMLIFDNAMRTFKNLSKRCGLRKEITATNCLTGVDLTLMADMPEYFPTVDLPETYRYIGPLTWTPPQAMPPPEWWPPETKGRRLVYITMGTTGISEFFDLLPGIFNKGNMSAILTTGGHPTNIKTNPPNIYVADFIDGNLAMQICRVAVCHGGNGTIYQALKHGKPVIGIPTLPDQEFNMRRVETLGLGKRMNLSEFVKRPQALSELIEEVSRSRPIAEKVAAFQREISRWRPAELGADYIERLMERR